MYSYLEEFYSQICHIDVLQFFNNYKNASKIHKELTESIGCYKAAVDIMSLNSSEERLVLIIGDGKFARTGSIFSHMSKWTCISIDPEMDINWFDGYKDYKASTGKPIRRLQCIRSTIEDAKFDYAKSVNFEKFILVFPHSHAKIKSSVQKFASVFGGDTPFDMVNMPCCVEVPSSLRTRKFLRDHNYISYCDTNVLSPKNTVHCWKNLTSNILKEKTK
jgi:hypothetical protein